MANENMNWLTEELQERIRQVFEPRYQKNLKDHEVVEIANNLTGFMETYLKRKMENESFSKNQSAQ